ncbi:hypothetical protein VNO77_20554 [Canavalia gladiata]|uniref:Mitochondrial inner membrane protease subunit 2 n=1 Tax=Canavalia gladiata TaxID=3824 RepID=A0AAN9LTD5_CANGL
MGPSSFLWNCAKKFVTAGLITVTVSDRYVTVIPVRGGSMSPTFNPKTDSLMEDVFDDYVLVEKFCLNKYKFSHGDVVVFRSPLNHKESHIKRILALPGEWLGTLNQDVLKIPEGHCWVEGDNRASSMDSKSFGPISLALIRGRVTHVVWPPQRIGAVKKSTPPEGLSSPETISKGYLSTTFNSSSFSHPVNMKFISEATILSLSILLFLSRTTSSLYQKPRNDIKTATFVSENFEMGPGSIAVKTFMDIKFPKGHIGVKSFDTELVDQEGNSIPLYETYLHHWFAIRYFENITMSHNPKLRHNPDEGLIYKRNEGTCNGYILPHYWGFGSESRGTTSHIPDPFAVELGNPKDIPNGHEEKWLFNIMVIDTRGVQHRKGCTECRCDLLNLPNNFYNITMDIHGQPLNPDYKGGFFCCQDNLQCKLKKGFQGPRRKISLRYKIRWVEWNKYQVPVKVYILDSTDKMKSNGSKILHDCQVEFTIFANGSGDSSHVQKANILMEKGGYLIYAAPHMHTGVVNATLYGQDGRILCTSTPKYGTGKEAGNEEGYIVGMPVCYPQPGSIRIKDGETLTLESRYKNEFRTGVMGHFYIYLAEQLPHEDIKNLM